MHVYYIILAAFPVLLLSAVAFLAVIAVGIRRETAATWPRPLLTASTPSRAA
jgi:hypothetical protein